MKIIGHRGAAAVAPENTMASFAAAWAAGVAGVELDVHLTKDGELAVFHDANGNRLAGVDAEIARRPWAEVRTWRVDGEPVPRLAEVLAAAPEGTLTLVEIKSGRATLVPLAPLLAAAPGGARVGLLSFDPEIAAMARRCFPSTPVLLNLEPQEAVRLDRWASFAVAEHLDGLSIGWSDAFGQDSVRLIRSQRLQCAVWTVNEVEAARRARSLGVDWLMTDDPARLIAQVGRG